MVASSAGCEPCQRGRPLATTSMRRSSETGTSRFMSASRTWRATLAPASRHTRATACSRGSARVDRTPEVAQAVRWSPRESSTPWQLHLRGASGEGQAQAPQQQDPELRTGDGDIIVGGQEVQGAGSEGPCFGQQQRTGRRGEVRKMRLVRALIACTGSRTLPAPERPRVVISVWCRGRGGTGANDCPVRCLVPKVTQVCSGLGCRGRGRQGSVALQGGAETGGCSGSSGLDHGHRVAPRGPVRCEAVGRSGAETEPSEPLGKPGSVEAPGRQGGVPLFQQRCEAPSDSCIMLRGVLGREVRGEDAQKVVRAGGGAGAQEEPPRLQVIDGGNALEEPVLVIALTPKLARRRTHHAPRGSRAR